MHTVRTMVIKGLCISSLFLLMEAREMSFLKTEENGLMYQRRFLLDHNSTKAWNTLEQYASCSLTCIPGYEKLTEVCCHTGIDAVCLNLPWDMLKTRLGFCPGNFHSSTSIAPSLTAKIAVQQFAACSLTCVRGYEKLTEVCCQTGIKDVCSNLPWDILKASLGLCQVKSTTTMSTLSQQSTTLQTTMSTGVHTTKLTPYWLSWGKWHCEVQLDACFQRRFRSCSTGNDKDCIHVIGGVRYSIDICTQTSCPEHFASTTQPSTSAPPGTCQDDARTGGCQIPDILVEVCKDIRTAWVLCPASCNLCDTCWDYLNCSSPSAQKLFCGNEGYAIQYCRQTCGKCNHKPVPVSLNKCGDPVAQEEICKILQDEMCICNDPEVRALCDNYCSNKCAGYTFTGANCTPARRRKRDAMLNALVFP